MKTPSISTNFFPHKSVTESIDLNTTTPRSANDLTHLINEIMMLMEHCRIRNDLMAEEKLHKKFDLTISQLRSGKAAVTVSELEEKKNLDSAVASYRKKRAEFEIQRNQVEVEVKKRLWIQENLINSPEVIFNRIETTRQVNITTITDLLANLLEKKRDGSIAYRDVINYLGEVNAALRTTARSFSEIVQILEPFAKALSVNCRWDDFQGVAPFKEKLQAVVKQNNSIQDAILELHKEILPERNKYFQCVENGRCFLSGDQLNQKIKELEVYKEQFQEGLKNSELSDEKKQAFRAALENIEFKKRLYQEDLPNWEQTEFQEELKQVKAEIAFCQKCGSDIGAVLPFLYLKNSIFQLKELHKKNGKKLSDGMIKEYENSLKEYEGLISKFPDRAHAAKEFFKKPLMLSFDNSLVKGNILIEHSYQLRYLDRFVEDYIANLEKIYTHLAVLNRLLGNIENLTFPDLTKPLNLFG